MGKKSRQKQRVAATATTSTTTSCHTTHKDAWHGIICYGVAADDLRDTLQQDAKINHICKVSRQLLSQQYRSAQTEQLYGSRALCVRANLADRVLFAPMRLDDQSYLVCLEYIEHHRYDHSAFKDSASVERVITQLQAKYKNNPTQFMAEYVVPRANLLAETLDEHIEPCKTTFLTHYRGKFIELDPAQEEVVITDLPALVSGAAGSGKSCAAFLQLLKHRNWKQKLYITRSKPLADDMEKHWKKSLSVPTDAESVKFADYETFVREMCQNDLKEKEMVNQSHFVSWYSKKYKKTMTIKADTLYQEFQVISMCASVDNYLEQGKKVSLITDEEVKKKSYDCFADYKAYLSENNRVDLRFFDANIEEASYDLVIVDESQDFSPQQLKNLVRVAHADQHCFFLDTNQSDYVVSIRSYLANLLSEQAKRPISQYSLKVTYRNSHAVLRVANACLKLKNAIVRGKGDKEAYLEVKASSTVDDQGSAHWVSMGDSTKMDQLRQLAKRPDCAVLVGSEEDKTSALCCFNTPLIFTVKEIKGLEFPHIILFKIMQRNVFDEMAHLVGEDVANERQYNNLPKSEENKIYLEPLNELFVAITRATHACYMVEVSNRKQSNVQSFFQSMMSEIESESSTITETTTSTEVVAMNDDWRQIAKRLIEEEKLVQAIDVIEKKLNQSVSVTLKESPTRDGLMMLLDDQLINDRLVDREGQLNNDIDKDEVKRLLILYPSEVLRHLLSLQEKVFLDLLNCNYLKDGTSVLNLLVGQGIQALCASGDVKESSKMFHRLVSCSNGLHLLDEVLRARNDNQKVAQYRSITKKMLFHVGFDGKASVHHLMFHKNGYIVKGCLEANIELMKLNVSELAIAVKSFKIEDNGLSFRKSLLVILLEILDDERLFKKIVVMNKERDFVLDVNFKRNMPPASYYQSIHRKEAPSVWFVERVFKNPASFVLVLKLLKENKDILLLIKVEDLKKFYYLYCPRRPAMFNLFTMLSLTDVGIKLLMIFMCSSDKFATTVTIVDLFNVFPETIGTFSYPDELVGSCFFRETLKNDGEGVVTLLLSQNPGLTKQLTLDHLLQTSKISNMTSLDLIMKSDMKETILRIIVNQNPTLKKEIDKHLKMRDYADKFLSDIPANLPLLLKSKENVIRKCFYDAKSSSGKSIFETLKADSRGWDALWKYADGRENLKALYAIYSSNPGLNILVDLGLLKHKLDSQEMAIRLLFTAPHDSYGESSSNNKDADCVSIFQFLSLSQGSVSLLHSLLPTEMQFDEFFFAKLCQPWIYRELRPNGELRSEPVLTWPLIDLSSSDNGIDLLSFIFNKNIALSKLIDAKMFYDDTRLLCGASTGDTVFNCLCELPSGFVFIKKLLSMNPNLIQCAKADYIFASLKFKYFFNLQFFNCSVFALMMSNKEGLALFMIYYDGNEEVRNSLTAEQFLMERGLGDERFCIYDRLISSEDGVCFLLLIAKKDPTFKDRMIDGMKKYGKTDLIDRWQSLLDCFNLGRVMHAQVGAPEQASIVNDAAQTEEPVSLPRFAP